MNILNKIIIIKQLIHRFTILAALQACVDYFCRLNPSSEAAHCIYSPPCLPKCAGIVDRLFHSNHYCIKAVAKKYLQKKNDKKSHLRKQKRRHRNHNEQEVNLLKPPDTEEDGQTGQRERCWEGDRVCRRQQRQGSGVCAACESPAIVVF